MQICLIICNICQSWDRSGHSKNFGYESAKSRASRVYVLPPSRAYVLACLRALRACVLTCLVCLRECVRACVRACVLVMMKCFIFLRVCVLGVLFCLICFTFQYLNLCFAKFDIFVIYILIPNYKTI